MAASPYLWRILSKATEVESEKWPDLPALVNSGTVTRAGFYRAFNDFSLATKTPTQVAQTKLGEVRLTHSDVEAPLDKTWLAMCQIEAAESVTEIPSPSSVVPGTKVDARVYKLIQDFDPKGIGHDPSPFILNVQCEPDDDQDYETFYREEHLHMLSKVPGYRRSQRYRLVRADNECPEKVPRFMAVHEFEHLNAQDGPELREADASPNTRRVFGNAKMVNIRGFKLVDVFGDMKK